MIKNTWSIQSVISDYLHNKSDTHTVDNDWWFGSESGYCLRKRFLRRKGTKPSDLKTDQQLRKMEAGNIFHWWIQKRMEDAKVLINKEKEVIDEDLRYKGHYDMLVEKDGIKLMYDIKTVHSQAFHYFTDSPSDKKEHKMQLASYMLFSGETTEGRLLYISKDDLCLLEIPVKLDMWKDKVISELTQLNQCWKDKQLPPKIDDIQEENNKIKPQWQCVYCNYKTLCRGKNWEENIRKQLKNEKV